MSTKDASENKSSGTRDESDRLYEYDTEPSHVGGARYIICRFCGAESVPATPESLLHDADCQLARDR
jgi:hypothetical protein